MTSGAESSGRAVASGAPHGTGLGPVLLNMFFNDLDGGTKRHLIQFAMIRNWREWLTHRQAVRPFGETRTGWRVGRKGT